MTNYSTITIKILFLLINNCTCALQIKNIIQGNESDKNFVVMYRVKIFMKEISMNVTRINFCLLV